MPSYIPPHLRGQATSGSAPAGDGPPSTSTPAAPRYSDRGGSRGGRGKRGDLRGGSRGGLREEPRDSSRGGLDRRDRPQRRNFDDADVIHGNDITRHFWPQNDENVASGINSTTFHESSARPDQLSYMLLFVGANPRWNSDSVVFAKSNLGLLPGFVEQKLKHGGLQAGTQKAISEEDSLNDSAVAEGQSVFAQPEGSDITLAAEVSDFRSPIIPESASFTPALKGSKSDLPPGPSDVTTVPAAEFYSESHPPSYPSIPAIDYNPEEHEPIAVFQQVKSVSKDAFVFLGWHKVTRVNIIAPHSAELVRMQQQKWERRDKWGSTVTTQSRDASAWKSSMNHEWAVVRFEQLGDDAAPPKPQIKRCENMIRKGGSSEGRGATEMLQEMRLQE